MSETTTNAADVLIIFGITGDLTQVVRTAVINKRAGGVGLIVGRKSFERPLGEGVKLLHALQDVLPRRLDHGGLNRDVRRLCHSPSVYMSAVGLSPPRTGGAKSEPRLPRRVSLTLRGSTIGSGWRTHRLTRAATAPHTSPDHRRQHA